jgi:LysR family glycine cleavage system transcriptional activator
MLTEGFEKLVDSAHRIRGANEDSTLTVWMAPSFAAKWLIPRLHRFYEACPGIDLNITARTHRRKPFPPKILEGTTLI